MFHSYAECFGWEYQRNQEYIIFLYKEDSGYDIHDCKFDLGGVKANNYEYPVLDFYGLLYDATFFGAESPNVTKEEFVQLVKEAVQTQTVVD